MLRERNFRSWDALELRRRSRIELCQVEAIQLPIP
jgi:hypothetical protein